MIEKVYNGLLKFYKAAKKPAVLAFIGLFVFSFSSTIFIGDTPKYLYWPWIVLGGAMILFAFITGFIHILLGNKLKEEGKLDEAGNAKRTAGCCCKDCDCESCSCEVRVKETKKKVKKKNDTKKATKRKTSEKKRTKKKK